MLLNENYICFVYFRWLVFDGLLEFVRVNYYFKMEAQKHKKEQVYITAYKIFNKVTFILTIGFFYSILVTFSLVCGFQFKH